MIRRPKASLLPGLGLSGSTPNIPGVPSPGSELMSLLPGAGKHAAVGGKDLGGTEVGVGHEEIPRGN